MTIPITPPQISPLNFRFFFWHSHDEKKAFLWTLLISGLLIFPIILADYFYIDDLGRSIYGNGGWSGGGRPLASFIMSLLIFTKPVTDIAPLPQLLTIVLLSELSMLSFRRFTLIPPALFAICFSFIFCHGFYLENLSYRFDSIIMSVALACAFIPFLMDRTTLSPRKNALLGGFALICLLSTYQAAINVFICLIILELLIGIIQCSAPHIILKKLFIKSMQGILALSIYFVTILQLSTKRSEYGAEHQQMLGNNAIEQLLDNAYAFMDLLKLYFQGIALYFFIPVLICSLFAITYFMYLYLKKHTSSSAYLVVFISLIGVLSLCIMPAGLLLILNNTITMPRVFIGLGGVLFTLFLVSAIWLNQYAKRLAYMLALPLFFCLSFAYTYSNGLKAQKYFEDSVLFSITHELRQMTFNNMILLNIYGQMPISRTNQLLDRKYPLLTALIPKHINGNWGHGHRRFERLNISSRYSPENQTQMSHLDESKYSLDTISKQTPLIQNQLYKIYLLDQYIQIVFTP